MKMIVRFFGLCAVVSMLFAGCSKESNLLTSADQEVTPAVGEDALISFRSNDKSPAIWADCEGFRTVGTPTSFKPTAGPFDELYNGANFMDGLGAVSESKPGDKDWNGGRWHVNTLKESVDPDKYLNVCSVEDIDPEDFESTAVYFECPLMPSRGKGH